MKQNNTWIKDDTWNVRKATEADTEELMALERSCFDTDLMTPHQMQSMIRSTKACVMVITEQHDIVGAGMVVYKKGYARIYSFAIVSPYRRSKYGRILYQAIEEEIKRVRYTQIRLEVIDENHAGIGFWRAMGFGKYGWEPKYYANGKDAMLMEKVIE